MKKDYSRQVSLLCSTCGASQFEFDPAVAENIRKYTCITCNREFTHDELVRENGRIFEEEVTEIGKEVLKDAEIELKKTFKKAFRGNKFIKFK